MPLLPAFFFHWDWVLKFFFPGWSRTTIFLISIQCGLEWEVCATVPGWWSRWGLKNLLPTLVLNSDLPDLSFPSSKDYMCELLMLALRIATIHKATAMLIAIADTVGPGCQFDCFLI
jgi:hypothetical protein